MSQIPDAYASQTPRTAAGVSGHRLPRLAGGHRIAALSMAGLLAALGLLVGAGSTASAAETSGVILAWGYDAGGQGSVPSDLADETVVAVSGGAFHSLAVTSEGRVQAWGQNGYGQTAVPAPLADQTVTAVSAGAYQSLALTSASKVTAWGNNGFGETDVPASLADETVTAVDAGGYHSLALTTDGTITGWGYDGFGQATVPGSLADQTVTAVAGGEYHSLALTSDGEVTAWGDDSFGQATVPGSLADQTVTSIASGGFHNLALTSDGRVIAWGRNDAGQTDVPESLTGKTVVAISAGVLHSLALTSDGKITAWGSDSFGQAGVPESLDDQRVAAIDAGGYHNLAIAPSIPVVITSPSSSRVEVGAPVTFTAAATGTPQPTVQWQRANPGGDFVDIPGAVAATYRISTVRTGDDLDRFRAVFTNGAGSVATEVATLTVNDPPTAENQTVSTAYGTPLEITLTGTDPENDPLTFTVVQAPTHGALSDGSPTVTYTPESGYEGPDSFAFTSTDGTYDSAVASVDITVTEQPNRAPVATGQTLATEYGTPLAVTLTGTDPDNDPLTYAVVDGPDHGTLSGAGADQTYTPANGYEGEDSFSFTTNDGTLTSAPATVSVTVADRANQTPTAQGQTLTTAYETPLGITLTGIDPDGDPLTYTVVDGPDHGTLSGSGADQTYTPDDGYEGPDSFTFTSNDGTLTSEEATVSITVEGQPNRAPTAADQTLSTTYETPLDVTLTGDDPDDDPLTYTVLSGPTHGTLTGTGAGRTYTPSGAYEGADSFTFTATDGTLISAPATVSITVEPLDCVTATPRQEFAVHADVPGRGALIRTAGVTTTRAQLLIADVSVNGPAGGRQSVTGITSGGGLTWTLVQRSNATTGSTETWQTYAANPLTSVPVTATFARPGYSATMTVAGFSGALPLVGASAAQSGTASAPRVTVTPRASQSVVWAAGRVTGARYYPAASSGSRIVHSHAVAMAGAGYWTQSVDQATTKGQPVTVSTRTATPRAWGYTAVEIRSDCS